MIDGCGAFGFSVHNASIDSVAIIPFRKIIACFRTSYSTIIRYSSIGLATKWLRILLLGRNNKIFNNNNEIRNHLVANSILLFYIQISDRSIVCW